jgi:hypothetical protein
VLASAAALALAIAFALTPLPAVFEGRLPAVTRAIGPALSLRWSALSLRRPPI